VVVVNQTLVDRYFPGQDPIGKRLEVAFATPPNGREIVGVVADVRENRLRGKISPRFYGNYAHPIGTLTAPAMVVSAVGDPVSVVETVRRALAEVDRSVPVLNIRTLNEQLDRGSITQRLTADLSACFGALALLMAAIGLYGVMSYSMARRTAEIGIRIALGASQGSVLWMAMRETLWMVTVGVAIGLGAAWWLGRVVEHQLFGLSAADPLAIGVAIAVIVCAAGLAGLVPARRAARVDPMAALRSE
jgi:ABC-type antimicrobial peptide transport system permease subunit